MRASRSVKAAGLAAQIVAVIASPAELSHAMRLRELPDYFELRLDALFPVVASIESVVGKLAAPLIITARHPSEGGVHHLSLGSRRALLLRFMERAALIDIELRSAQQMESVLERAQQCGVKRILSVHDFEKTPTLFRLQQLSETAQHLRADVFKVATRVDSPEQLHRLLQFFDNAPASLPISAMGIGSLGRAARIALARRGSVLNYAHLSTAAVAGQMSLPALRRVLKS